jgi:hypothetical protein
MDSFTFKGTKEETLEFLVRCLVDAELEALGGTSSSGVPTDVGVEDLSPTISIFTASLDAVNTTPVDNQDSKMVETLERCGRFVFSALSTRFEEGKVDPMAFASSNTMNCLASFIKKAVSTGKLPKRTGRLIVLFVEGVHDAIMKAHKYPEAPKLWEANTKVTGKLFDFFVWFAEAFLVGECGLVDPWLPSESLRGPLSLEASYMLFETHPLSAASGFNEPEVQKWILSKKGVDVSGLGTNPFVAPPFFAFFGGHMSTFVNLMDAGLDVSAKFPTDPSGSGAVVPDHHRRRIYDYLLDRYGEVKPTS